MHESPMMANPPPATISLFAAYPRLAESVQRLRLGDWPTPISNARRFAEAHGLGGLFIKREDLSHTVCGGNKVRGLEFLLAEARRRDAGTLVTFGAIGSHHVCRTAWHARRLDMKTIAVVVQQPVADYARRNLLVGLTIGASYVSANYATLIPKLAWQLFRHRRDEAGRPARLIPAGGTSPLACLGHVNAAFELKQQIDAGLLPEPDMLFAAMGSLGTMAGLAVGCRLAGLRSRLVGIVASYRWYCTPRRWARLARRTHRLMQRLDPSVPDVTIEPAELSVVGTARGPGYAQFTEPGMKLARQFFECEGIRLDGTYTAKALDGALQFIRRHRLEDKTHLFWHSLGEVPPIGDVDMAMLPRSLRRFLDGDNQPLDRSFEV